MEMSIEAKNGWDPHIYKLHKEAPRPLRVISDQDIERPSHYGLEYHGALSSRQAQELLTREGEYLVRKGKDRDSATLSFRVNGTVHHYHLHYDGNYFVKADKKFSTLANLVAEGLVVHFMERHAPAYIFVMPPPAAFHDSKRLPLRRSLAASDQQRVLSNRRHHFKVHNFGWLNRCDWCGVLWGFNNQGVKCEGCGYGVHQKCSENMNEDCASLKRSQGVFGVDVTDLAEAYGTERPFIVDKCIQEIERRGMDAEGLYRVSGFSDEIEALKSAFERDGAKTDISPAAYDNIHVVTGILKRWLKLLPQPLIGYHVQPALFDAIKRSNGYEKEECVRNALKNLSPVPYDTLQYLMAHLHRVVQFTHLNRMTSFNMAVVLAPTLMFSDDLDSLNNNINVIELLINKCNYIFK